MLKEEFLTELRKGLSGFPKSDIEERVTFYGEMIDDRMEDGKDEETAVAEIGNAEEIIKQIIADTPLAKLVKEKISRRKRLKAWEILLLVLGAPLWLPIIISVIAVILTVYAVLWVAIISLWAAFVSLAACGFGGIAAGIYFAAVGNGLTGIAVTGGGIICAGLSVFMFFGCKAATKGILIFTKKLAVKIKNLIIGKEKSNA